MFEAAQLVNQRPIGAHPSRPEDGSYICPNDLILGRLSMEVPQGPFKERSSLKFRLDFIEKLVDGFWKQWARDVFPSLVIQPKWHVERRDVQVDDVVLIQDANTLRGQWKLAIVTKTVASTDGRVRRVEVTYSNNGKVTVERPVQKLIVLVPKED